MRRVLCATDFSDGAAAALDVAVAIARPFPAEVRIVHVRPAPPPSCSPMSSLRRADAVDAGRPTDAGADLDRCRQAALASGLPIQGVLLRGDPADQIVQESRRAAADIIVMGRHSQGAPNPWILGSVAERVLRKAPCPVVVVRPFPRHRGEKPRRVLCGLDLGDTAETTLRYAIDVAGALGADLQVIHVASPGGEDDARRALASALSRAAPAEGPSLRQARVVTGLPHEQILRVAGQDDADLIVVGSHGGGVVDRQFLGSTTLHLLREAETPVLVVPADVAGAEDEPDAGVDAAPARLVRGSCAWTSNTSWIPGDSRGGPPRRPRRTHGHAGLRGRTGARP